VTSSHRYGPHREEDAPNAVTVYGPGTTQGGQPYPAAEVRPIPDALRRQREWINQNAHFAALLEGGGAR
jgi:hypothetical protein